MLAAVRAECSLRRFRLSSVSVYMFLDIHNLQF